MSRTKHRCQNTMTQRGLSVKSTDILSFHRQRTFRLGRIVINYTSYTDSSSRICSACVIPATAKPHSSNCPFTTCLFTSQPFNAISSNDWLGYASFCWCQCISSTTDGAKHNLSVSVWITNVATATTANDSSSAVADGPMWSLCQ